MRSMTGYGRGEADCEGIKLSVELSTVNRKQSEIAINLPRDLTELEARIRQAINARISRGRTNVLVAHHASSDGTRRTGSNHHRYDFAGARRDATPGGSN